MANDQLERRNQQSRAELISRIRDEFNYMAGMSLTHAQALRLFNMDPALGERVLNELVSAGVLTRLHDGSYARPKS